MINQFFKLEWLNLRRSPALIGGVFLVFICGIYAIFYGKMQMEKHASIVAKMQTAYQEKEADLQKKYATDTLPNMIGNRINAVVDHTPTEWAALSVGVRDVQPNTYSIRYWQLTGQIFTAEIGNPLKWLTGNFDLAFVFIYLLPLLLIALSFNVLSIEEELGTLPFLLSNGVELKRLVLSKLGFRFGIAATLIVLLTLIGTVATGGAFSEKTVIWLVAALLYAAFWLAASAWIASLQRNSAFNAMALLGLWLLFVVVLPSMVNLAASTFYPTSVRHSFTHEAREKMTKMWADFDEPAYQESVLNDFYKKYPQLPRDTSNYNQDDKVMFAAYERYDAEMMPLVQAYLAETSARDVFAQNASFLSPATLIQTIFNEIAETNWRHQHHFLTELQAFHGQLKVHFFEKVYANKSFTKADYAAIPRFKHQSVGSRNIAVPMLLLSVLTLSFVFFGTLNFKRNRVMQLV